MSQSQRDKIVFSDESKFCLNGNVSKGNICMQKTENSLSFAQGTEKFSKSVMVSSCFSEMGVGRLVFVDKNIDSIEYINILSNNLSQSIRSMNLPVFSFQQDNARPHISKLTKEYFEHMNIDVLEWPERFSDLNPIENI
ncbi:Transposable element Tc3 transposase [Cucumispora dikerogammari]|nr:Transposable element Tc3 transposase [Cucumispora dikerogammari]